MLQWTQELPSNRTDITEEKREQPTRIFVLGLENAGKQTFLQRLSDPEIIKNWTESYNIPNQKHKKVLAVAWTIGCKIRNTHKYEFMQRFYKDCLGLIVIVDSADISKLEEMEDELWRLIEDKGLSGKPLLVFANKQDLPNALPVHKIVDILGLSGIHDREWYIEGCSMITRQGVWEGLKWIGNAISNMEYLKKKERQKNQRKKVSIHTQTPITRSTQTIEKGLKKSSPITPKMKTTPPKLKADEIIRIPTSPRQQKKIDNKSPKQVELEVSRTINKQSGSESNSPNSSVLSTQSEETPRKKSPNSFHPNSPKSLSKLERKQSPKLEHSNISNTFSELRSDIRKPGAGGYAKSPLTKERKDSPKFNDEINTMVPELSPKKSPIKTPTVVENEIQTPTVRDLMSEFENEAKQLESNLEKMAIKAIIDEVRDEINTLNEIQNIPDRNLNEELHEIEEDDTSLPITPTY